MIQDEAIFIGEADGTAVFKAHATVRTPHAAQISGVYTVPAERRRGYGRAGMEALARRLLQDHPHLCLYVNADNTPAIRVYEAAGFRREGTFKSIFLTRGID